MRVRRFIYAVLLAVFLLTTNGCVTVKGYEKVYLNDREMDLTLRAEESYDEAVHTYREGAAGGTGGKTGGGCGCN